MSAVISFWGASLLVIVVLVAVLVVLVRLYLNLVRFCKDVDTHQLALSAQIKQLQGTLAELLGEMRRANRLTNEQLELKRAEMTGDFEIVEEPILPPPFAKTEGEEAAAHGMAANLPKSFPRL